MKRISKITMAAVLSLMVAVTMIPMASFATTGGTSLNAPVHVTATAYSKTSVKVKWDKVKDADGYIVYFSKTGKTFKRAKEIKSAGKVTYVKRKLAKNRNYYFKVKAFKKKKYSKYSIIVSASTNKAKNVKKLTLNKSKLRLVAGTSEKVTTKLSPSKNIVSSKVTWQSANNKVATVKNGNITAVAKGNTVIRAFAHDGVCAAISVTVYPDETSMIVSNFNNQSAACTKFADELGYELAYNMDLADDKTGFRTAGSDAEHRTADYLEDVWNDIGLTDVVKEGVTVDKWQFNDAWLEIKFKNPNGTKNRLKITDMVSYAAPGTVQLPEKDFSKMEIVEMGMGTEEDYLSYYEKSGAEDMSGKIVLAAVNQFDETWIDGPYEEAYVQGAEAIITYQNGGYGQYNDDTVNIQDICCSNLGIPCVSISPNDAARIKKAIKVDSNAVAELYVDNYVGDEEGTAYNVVGKIEGTGNTGQQILFAAHYDKYFYGFEDDCVAVGLVAGIAKAMIDSGYKPVNDIYFVAHAAEEWGEFDTGLDWATGSWKEITEAHPEWQGTTLALMNYELPAIDNFKADGFMRTSAENGNIGQEFLDSNLTGYFKPFYSDGVIVKNDEAELYMTDCVSYQQNGVPIFMPRQDNRKTWTKNRYHTKWDNNVEEKVKDDGVYSKELLKYDLNLYASLAAYIDSKPALELDFGGRCDKLEAALEGADAYMNSETIGAYEDALDSMKKAAAKTLAEGQKINLDYAAAVKKGDTEAAKTLREQGTEYNTRVLKAFCKSQDKLVGLSSSASLCTPHSSVQTNLDLYNATIDALTDNSVTEDDIWIPAELFGWYEYYAYLYSEATCAISQQEMSNSLLDEDNWGDRLDSQPVDAWKTVKNMYNYYNETGSEDPQDYKGFVNEYKEYVTLLTDRMQKCFNQEIEGMNEVTDILN